jgi:nucleoside-diphosphate-sugar epimerase
VRELAEIVRTAVGFDVAVEVVPTDDNRSYHVSAAKIRRALGFIPRFTIEDAVRELCDAFATGKVGAMNDSAYHNITRMREVSLR